MSAVVDNNVQPNLVAIRIWVDLTRVLGRERVLRDGPAERVVVGHLVRADPDVVAPHDKDSRSRRDPLQVPLRRRVGSIVGVYAVRRDEHIAPCAG